MTIFTKLNRKHIDDRQIDTLIGLAKGLTADGVVNQAEAEFLQSWLVQARSASDNPIIANLMERVSDYLSDGELDSSESEELRETLGKICGASSEIGELAKTSLLPIDDPLPTLHLPGAKVLFTGTFAYGSRAECKKLLEEHGGAFSSGVTKNLDYLVLGTYVTDSWAHESFGRKIEKAVDYRNRGSSISIVPESHWLRSCGVNV